MYSPIPSPALTATLASEGVSASTVSLREHDPREAWSAITFGLIWTVFMVFFSALMFGSLFTTGYSDMEINGVPTRLTLDNLFDIGLFPVIFVAVFYSIGLLILASWIRKMFKKGGMYVITLTRLIEEKGDTIQAYDWREFSGNTVMTSRDIRCDLKTGEMVTRNRRSQFVPHRVYIQTHDASFLALMQQRIRENRA